MPACIGHLAVALPVSEDSPGSRVLISEGHLIQWQTWSGRVFLHLMMYTKQPHTLIPCSVEKATVFLQVFAGSGLDGWMKRHLCVCSGLLLPITADWARKQVSGVD